MPMLNPAKIANLLVFSLLCVYAVQPAKAGFDMSEFSTADTGDYGRSSQKTGDGIGQGPGKLTTAKTGKQNQQLQEQAWYGLLAPGTQVGTGSFPSGQWTYGFPATGGGPYQGVCGGSQGGTLPPTSTSSVDINIVER